MHILVTEDGSFFQRLASDAAFAEATLPAGTTVQSLRPWGFVYEGALYVGGIYTRPLVYYKNSRVLRTTGITAPADAPVLATGGGTGITGSCVAYCAYAEIDGDGNILQESSLSLGSAVVSFSDQSGDWSVIPHLDAEARVTHVILYRTVSGSVPYRVTQLAIGTTTYSDTLDSESLIVGTTGPLDDAGNRDDYARGVPPNAVMGCVFEDKGWYITSTDRRVFYSKIFEPGSVSSALSSAGQLTLSSIKIPSGEVPVAICPRESELVVLCLNSCWRITGWGAGDYSIQRIGRDGCIATHSAVNIRDGIWWAGPEGYMYYGGNGVRNLMHRSKRTAWMADFAANPDAFRDGVAIDNLRGRMVFLTARGSEPKSIYYIANYRAMTEDGQVEPWWWVWYRNRKDTAIGLLNGVGERRATPVYGSEDGYLRQDDATDDDDDGDTYLKAMSIVRPCYYPKGPGGDKAHGLHWTNLTLHMTHENQAVRVRMYPGDHTVYGTARPAYDETWPATARSKYQSQSNQTETVRQVSGTGLTIRYDISRPLGIEYLGETLMYEGGSDPGRTPS